MKKGIDRKKLMTWIVVMASLIAAFFIGRQRTSASEIDLIKKAFTDQNIVCEDARARIYTLYGDEDTLSMKTADAVGYGGRMVVGTLYNPSGEVLAISLILDTETYSYVKKLENRGYFKQYRYKPVSEAFVIGHDLDAVSGATISSKAIASAARDASHSIAKEQFGLDPEEVTLKFKLATYEIGILLFFLLSVILIFWVKKRILKQIAYALSIILLGFVWNSSFSVSFLLRIFLGDFPPFADGLLFWIYIIFLLGGIVLLRKNLYCYQICPFFGIQYFLARLTGIKWDLIPFIKRYSHQVNGVLLWLVILSGLLENNSTVSSYEPFSMMFALQGNGTQWLIFPVILIGSLFVSQYFCRYFCPVGALSSYLLKVRKGKLLSPKKAIVCKPYKMLSKRMKFQSVIVSILYLLSLFAILTYLLGVLFS